MVARRNFLEGMNLSKNHQHRPISSIRDYQEYKMFTIENGTNTQRELVFGEVSWGDNIESLGMELNFTLPRNKDDRHLAPYDVVNVGDGIVFTNLEDVIFEGMVETVQLERYAKKITCYDYGYLLSKTDILKQFNEVSGHSAIQSICSDIGIPVGNIEAMSAKITEIYNNTSVSDIFKGIIEEENKQTGKRLVMEMREGKLYIEDMNMNVIQLSHKPAANISTFDPSDVPGDITKSATLDNMKNHVQVVYQQTEDDITTVRTVATASNNESIEKYGKRVHVENINEDEMENAQTIANNKLRELQGMEIKITVEMLGDDKARSGRVVEVDNESYNLSGKYKIINCEQSYYNRTRKMVLDLEGV